MKLIYVSSSCCHEIRWKEGNEEKETEGGTKDMSAQAATKKGQSLGTPGCSAGRVWSCESEPHTEGRDYFFKKKIKEHLGGSVS